MAGEIRRLRYVDFVHGRDGCPGEPKIEIVGDVPLAIEGLGLVVLPQAAYLTCMGCMATYFFPGFEEEVRRNLLAELASKESWTWAEVRFARINSDVRASEVADAMGETGDSYLLLECGGATHRDANSAREALRDILWRKSLD